MSLVAFFTAALIAISGLLALLSLATALRKSLRAAQERRHARLEAALRPRLLALLAQDDPDPAAFELRGRAAGRSLDALATGLLRKLRGEDRRVLTALLESTGEIDRARRDTRRTGPVRRARAAELLGAAGVADALPDLTRLLRDRDPDVRAAAARALGKLGRPEAVPSLLATLGDERSVPAGVVSMALLHLGPACAPALREGLDLSNGPHVRALAAELLGRLGAIEATDRLIEAVDLDPAPEVRAAAARALGRAGVPRAAAPLERALGSDPAAEVRRAAAWALGELGGGHSLDGLAIALGSGDHALARQAAHSLLSCGPGGLSLLERAAQAREPASGAGEARETLALLLPAGAAA
jgi:HEAT repeat protein